MVVSMDCLPSSMLIAEDAPTVSVIMPNMSNRICAPNERRMTPALELSWFAVPEDVMATSLCAGYM
jgi:hypothetical protein